LPPLICRVAAKLAVLVPVYLFFQGHADVEPEAAGAVVLTVGALGAILLDRYPSFSMRNVPWRRVARWLVVLALLGAAIALSMGGDDVGARIAEMLAVVVEAADHLSGGRSRLLAAIGIGLALCGRRLVRFLPLLQLGWDSVVMLAMLGLISYCR